VQYSILYCTEQLWNPSYNLPTSNFFYFLVNNSTFIYVYCQATHNTSAKPYCLISDSSLEASLFNKIRSFISHEYAAVFPSLILIFVRRVCSSTFTCVLKVYTNGYLLGRVCLSVLRLCLRNKSAQNVRDLSNWSFENF
jgi:hypothetical protein